MAETRARVVIVGAGFGGLACARKLDGEPVDVVLLDQHNYHLFTPLLYQVATGLLNPSDIAYPLRTVFRHSPNVRFQQARVDTIDFQRKVVRLARGDEIAYDDVVVASGSVDNYFGNQAIAKASISLKGLPDATGLRNHVLTCLERADAEPDPAARQALLTFVIVGGGPTGAEGAYAWGDVAAPEIDGTGELPMWSPPAMQAGRYVARAILEKVGGTHSERPPFHYVDKGTMATIGRNAGVTHLPGGLEITGFLGWRTWIFVHIYYLIGFRNRISALSSWAWDYLRHDRPIRSILAPVAAPD